jgi:hypothetical protein
MCGLSALRFGWLTTCRGTVVVVSDPGAVVVVVVVVVDPVAGVVVVVVLDCANEADAGIVVRTVHTVIAAATRPNPDRITRTRAAARELPNCDRLKFIPAPEYA